MFSVNGEAEAISTPAGKVSSSGADLGRRRTRADGIRCCFVDSGVEAPERQLLLLLQPALASAVALHFSFTEHSQTGYCTVYYRYKYKWFYHLAAQTDGDTLLKY